MADNREAVAEMMRSLGQAWRGDWSDFDGRTLRASMDGLASWLNPESESVTYGTLCVAEGVCPVNRCWPEHCPEVGPGNWCSHLEAAADVFRAAGVTGKDAEGKMNDEGGEMLTVDARCTMRQCADIGDIYRMVGRCGNCGAEPVLVLITSGHEVSKVDCPKCGVNAVRPTRLATDDEIPVA